jgi:hypothetical protein
VAAGRQKPPSKYGAFFPSSSLLCRLATSRLFSIRARLPTLAIR